MKIVFCWRQISGYLAHSLRQLATLPNVELRLLAFTSGAEAPFDPAILNGLDCQLLDATARHDTQLIYRQVEQHAPDILVLNGWSHPPYRRLATADLGSCRTILAADTQLRFTWRQRLARLKLNKLFRNVDAVWMPGDRGVMVMRYWGVPEEKIFRGVYGIDVNQFEHLHAQRLQSGWPKRFGYFGRYVPEKGLDTLAEAYRQFLQQTSEKWDLRCYGSGPMRSTLEACPRIDVRDFLQPSALPQAYAECGAFVIASTHEPWGQVIVEAAAAGLPIICTEACGAGPELVRGHYNGLIVPTGNVAALRNAMLWMASRDQPELASMGHRSREFARPFGTETWAQRFLAMCQQVREQN